jgi:hypothetical protein
MIDDPHCSRLSRHHVEEVVLEYGSNSVLGLFSRSFYEALKEFFREVSEDQNAVPGVIISIQTYGRDPVPFHPHIHCLGSDGCFSRDGSFHPIPWVDTERR